MISFKQHLAEETRVPARFDNGQPIVRLFRWHTLKSMLANSLHQEIRLIGTRDKLWGWDGNSLMHQTFIRLVAPDVDLVRYVATANHELGFVTAGSIVHTDARFPPIIYDNHWTASLKDHPVVRQIVEQSHIDGRPIEFK